MKEQYILPNEANELIERLDFRGFLQRLEDLNFTEHISLETIWQMIEEALIAASLAAREADKDLAPRNRSLLRLDDPEYRDPAFDSKSKSDSRQAKYEAWHREGRHPAGASIRKAEPRRLLLGPDASDISLVIDHIYYLLRSRSRWVRRPNRIYILGSILRFLSQADWSDIVELQSLLGRGPNKAAPVQDSAKKAVPRLHYYARQRAKKASSRQRTRRKR